MRFDSLNQWLAWQETLNPTEIELGLDRIDQVRESANILDHFDCPLIIVGGTNGKGSVMAMLEAIASAAGYRVCAYTSPHLLRYNERIRVNGREVEDRALCESFERIDQARGDICLTYFEFGTLAALDLFTRAEPDLVLLEVGLGGRLDAVNIMQPDVSVLTTVDIDHVDWLGPDRESIGFEKAGIMRSGKTTICGDRNPPRSVLKQAHDIAANCLVLGKDFDIASREKNWKLQSSSFELEDLPRPALVGEFQLDNAATAIMALAALQDRLELKTEDFCDGLVSARLPGRFECLHEQPRVIADVAHNTQAVTALYMQLKQDVCAGKTRVVIAMLADKPVVAVIELLKPLADAWYCAGLDTVNRGMPAAILTEIIQNALAGAGDAKLYTSDTVVEACEAALDDASAGDRIIVLGSFYTVAAAKSFFSTNQNLNNG